MFLRISVIFRKVLAEGNYNNGYLCDRLQFFFVSWRLSPQWARASSLSRLHDHTQTHHTR